MSVEGLDRFGWNPETDQQWQNVHIDNTIPARVVADFGHQLKVATPSEYTVSVAGSLKHNVPNLLPKVGDWVAIRLEGDSTGVIQSVFARSSTIARRVPGPRVEKQVLAANVDLAFIVQTLNDNFSLERLDRYMFQLEEANVVPIFVFNKIDVADDIKQKLDLLNTWGREYLLTDAKTGQGVDTLRSLLKKDLRTAVFLGSSGVGKSTLTNQLLGEDRQKTNPTREDDRGRHTTSHRELFLVPTGGVIIDTPGIRELQLWGEEGSLEAVFPDIVELALKCKFRNCQHGSKEQGCAVQKALSEGKLSYRRLESYLKLRQELEDLAP